MHHLFMGRYEFIESGARLLEQATSGFKAGLLLQECDARPGMEADGPVVRAIDADQQAKQRGLADAIRTDQADTVAGQKLEPDVGKEGPLVKAAGQARTT
jgi:hypothetical protein